RVVFNNVGARLGLLAFALVGCGSSSGPARVCRASPSPNEATIELGCFPAEPPAVNTTGPCSVACPTFLANGSAPAGDHCPALRDSNKIELTSTGAGICHVEVTFGNGTTSSVDVEFVSEWRACESNPHGYGRAVVPIVPDGVTGRLSVPDASCEHVSQC